MVQVIRPIQLCNSSAFNPVSQCQNLLQENVSPATPHNEKRFVAGTSSWWGAFSWTVSCHGAVYITGKEPFLGHTKPGWGGEKYCGCTGLGPCWVCSGGNICDLQDRTLRDKCVTEGKAQIFNDLPQAHHQPKRLLGQVQLVTERNRWIDFSICFDGFIANTNTFRLSASNCPVPDICHLMSNFKYSSI